MAISEERLQILLPSQLKRVLEQAARRAGVSMGEYVRRVLITELGAIDSSAGFPFGQSPIRTGRTSGSVDHDRPE